MLRDPLVVLAQLAAAGAIAFLSIWLLVRATTRTAQSGLVKGYPPSLFPLQELLREGPLATLAGTQLRLLRVYEHATPQSDLAIWLGQFLPELRAIMDSAYRAAAASQLYGRHPALERLAAEVQALESQISALAVDLILSAPATPAQDGLDARLATLRLCAEQIALAAPLATAPF